MKNKLQVGKIVNTHGIKGEVKILNWCDDASMFEYFKKLFLQDGAELCVLGVKYQKNNVILKLKGYDTIEQTQSLMNEILYADKSEFGKLPDSTYFVADLIGIEVYDTQNNLLGIIDDVFRAGGADVYSVKNQEDSNLLVPAIKQVVKNIDINNKKMTIELIEGLL